MKVSQPAPRTAALAKGIDIEGSGGVALGCKSAGVNPSTFARAPCVSPISKSAIAMLVYPINEVVKGPPGLFTSYSTILTLLLRRESSLECEALL